MDTPTKLGQTADREASTSLNLIGAFELRVSGRPVPLPHTAERVAAFLALADRPVSRSRLAGALWCGQAEPQASKNLRTALWRLGRIGGGLVSARDDRIALAPGVPVDVSELTQVAQALISRPDPGPARRGVAQLVACRALLPDWEEEWVVVDRERYRLLRLEALESVASDLLSRHRLADALLVASAAVHSEPLRETARQLVVRIQIEQGNVVEALRTYHEYRSLLRTEFGLEPSLAFTRLVEPFGRTHDAVTAP